MNPITWTVDDAVRLRTFLKQTPAFIPVLRAKLTKSTGNTTESRVISSTERAGGENIIEEIEKLKQSPIAGDKAPAIIDPETNS